MSVAHAVNASSVRDQVSEEEWETRVDLAALYRMVAHYGWDDLIYTHISARVPGPDHHFLINPYGWAFDEITASSLVKIDIDGNVVMESPYRINPAGFTIHSAIHAAREDAKCVIHLHTDDGVAVSAQKDGLLPISQHAMQVHGFLAYHDYEGIALDLDERERLVADLGDNYMLMLRNHGTLAVGKDCEAAWLAIFFLERACTMQVRAQAGGQLNFVSDAVVEKVKEQSRPVYERGGGGLPWAAVLRKLDRLDPSFRD